MLTFTPHLKREDKADFNHLVEKNRVHFDELVAGMSDSNMERADIGWLNPDDWASDELVSEIQTRADFVKAQAEVLVLIGVGGSNQAARAVIEALGTRADGLEILYAGINLSGNYYEEILRQCADKEIHVHVIAKNFETLEPGLGFRLLYDLLKGKYGKDAPQHVTITGTKGSYLEELSKEQGFYFLEFPENVGGRFTALTSVGLFPIAVAGLDVTKYVKGAKDYRDHLRQTDDVAILEYATYRNWLDLRGFRIEGLAFFEPQLFWFSKWWEQLFAESEGKDRAGLFPVSLNYSEQLHSVGQYVQDGTNNLFETFLVLEEKSNDLKVPETDLDDRFEYLDGMDLDAINEAAEQATMRAHASGGVPISSLEVPQLDEYAFGQLFYFFELAVVISARILGVNPYDQPGVEAYKALMFDALGKE